MKTTTKYLTIFAVTAAGLGLGAAGCDSTSTCTDAGVCPDGGKGGTSAGLGGTTGGLGGSTGAGGSTAFGITPGTYCFEIVSIAPGSSDGCEIGVAGLVSTPAKPTALPVTYYDVETVVGTETIPKGTIMVGTEGSVGRGVIDANMATLLRDGPAMAPPPDQACSWHQTDTTAFTLTATNMFTIAVSENEDTFTAACAAPAPTCTSTWTWTMAIMSPQVLQAANGCK